MTYIDYVNQFWKTHQSVAFSSNEVYLYFFLLNECNSRGWENPFECPNRRIVLATGISEPTVIEVRNRLQQKGLLQFESKLRKAQEERLEEEQKDSWKESQSAQGIVRKKILGSDNKVLMQINKGDRKISVYKKGSRDYTLVYDNKDRYTLIRMQADIPQYQLKEIFIQ